MKGVSPLQTDTGVHTRVQGQMDDSYGSGTVHDSASAPLKIGQFIGLPLVTENRDDPLGCSGMQIPVRKDWRKLVLVDLSEMTAQLWQSTKPPRTVLTSMVLVALKCV